MVLGRLIEWIKTGKKLNICSSRPSTSQLLYSHIITAQEHICSRRMRLTLSQKTILDSTKLKEFADDNFKFDENGRKFLKWVENTVRKGEIAPNEQFLPIPQCFQKTCTAAT